MQLMRLGDAIIVGDKLRCVRPGNKRIFVVYDDGAEIEIEADDPQDAISRFNRDWETQVCDFQRSVVSAIVYGVETNDIRLIEAIHKVVAETDSIIPYAKPNSTLPSVETTK